MNKKKQTLLMLICFLLLLSGCSTREEAEPVRLSFIHGWGGTLGAHALMQEIYDEFDERNEDIILSSQPSSDSSIAVEKANDMLALNEMTNIVSTNGQFFFVENAMKQDVLLDIMPYIREDAEFMSLIHPSVLKVWTNTDGSIYTLPDALEVMGYWYNEAYFKEAGIVDEEGNAAPPKTWEEFYLACEKLRVWNESTKKLKAVYALEKVQTVESLLLARLGGESEEGLAMASKTPETYDTEVFRSVVREFAKLYAYSTEADSLEDARAYFMDGSTAMYFNGVWESEIIQGSRLNGEIAYANYPTNYGFELSYISPSSGYVVYNSPDPRENEAAIRFLKYMLSKEVQTRLATETGQAPSNPGVDNQLIAEQYPVLGNALDKAHKAAIQLKAITLVWNQEAIDIITNELEQACSNPEKLEKMIQKLNTSY